MKIEDSDFVNLGYVVCYQNTTRNQRVTVCVYETQCSTKAKATEIMDNPKDQPVVRSTKTFITIISWIFSMSI